MRVLILMLVFAIGFSGFAAAAHTFDSSQCGQTFFVEKMDDTQIDCAKHLDSGAKGGQKSKDVSHSCANCGHCCMSHAALSQFGINIVVPIHKTAFPNIDVEPEDDFISGLKRPPRIFG
ncbi:MAG TPA: hypothetical protein DEA55_01770 [Rhodospirillaceae bacterium]|nr:hypothetical protein [Rhodospirillaceae bacterium]